jgi:hypothetical protein
MEKKLKHNWDKNGRRNHTCCIVCGCIKDRGVYSIRYTTLNGEITQHAPPCIEPIYRSSITEQLK